MKNAVVEVATAGAVARVSKINLLVSISQSEAQPLAVVALLQHTAVSISGHSISAVAPDYNFYGGIALGVAA